jgi:hypothetical protein
MRQRRPRSRRWVSQSQGERASDAPEIYVPLDENHQLAEARNPVLFADL